MNPVTSMITLNVNGQNTRIKRQRLPEWIKNKTQLHIVYNKCTLNIKQLVSSRMKKTLFLKFQPTYLPRAHTVSELQSQV